MKALKIAMLFVVVFAFEFYGPRMLSSGSTQFNYAQSK